jgi:hypothetical protein
VTERLGPELTWQADGHLAEVAIAAVADGQDGIVADDAVAHLSSCGACGERLGRAALESGRIHKAMVLAARQRVGDTVRDAVQDRAARSKVVVRVSTSVRPASAPPPDSARRAVPVKLVSGGLALAGISAAPAVLDLAGRWPELTSMATRSLPLVVKSAVVMMRGAAEGVGLTIALVSWAAAVLLVVSGVWIARSMRRVSLEGGV